MNIKTVYIEITNRCNLNCRTCYNRSGLNRTTHEIPLDGLEAILQTTAQYGANRFLFSGGEPSLHSQFHQILEMTDRYPQASFGFVTNGTNGDAVWIDYLNSHDNLTLQISLDGSDEEQNSLTRGIGNFEKTLRFAQQIKNPNLKRLLKMVISQSNLSDVESFYRLAISLGFTPEFAFIYKSGNATDAWENKMLSPQQKLKVLKLVDKLNHAYKTEALLPRCTVACPFVFGTDNLSICIKTDGSIQPCQSLYAPEFTIGNIFDFKEEAFLKNLDRITALAKQRAATDFGCQKCLLKDVCKRGCMAEAYHTSANPLGNDESCMYRKLQFLDFEIKKNASRASIG
ncbi:MAG: radical SAM protein [Clostridia bacterium]|nr:radical SAM protein [Clostridia bacterium]